MFTSLVLDHAQIANTVELIFSWHVRRNILYIEALNSTVIISPFPFH